MVPAGDSLPDVSTGPAGARPASLGCCGAVQDRSHLCPQGVSALVGGAHSLLVTVGWHFGVNRAFSLVQHTATPIPMALSCQVGSTRLRTPHAPHRDLTSEGNACSPGLCFCREVSSPGFSLHILRFPRGPLRDWTPGPQAGRPLLRSKWCPEAVPYGWSDASPSPTEKCTWFCLLPPQLWSLLHRSGSRLFAKGFQKLVAEPCSVSVRCCRRYAVLLAFAVLDDARQVGEKDSAPRALPP